ncbi:hypothetical protein ACH5RR_006346 [Cinchona calisaya]|uniref:RING-type domain-containing protein n=1 Tax=Cinchona calisaya TaxID=153742 RepID=A0ABD3ANT2_9GENT
MAMIENFGTIIRVFNWNVNLPGEAHRPQSNPTHHCLFFIRLTTLIPSDDDDDDEKGSLLNPFREALLWHVTTESNYGTYHGITSILREILERIPFLGACKNLGSAVRQISADVICKFRFVSDEISSDHQEGPKPVIFIELAVRMTREALKSDRILQIAASFDHDQGLNNLAYGHGSTCEQMEDVLKSLSNVQESKGLNEVKARLEIKRFGDDTEVIEDCSICMERFFEGQTIVKTSCSHVFHRICLFNWLLRANSCPYCRSSCAVYV